MGIYHSYSEPKIVYQNVSRYYKFAYDSDGYFPDMNVFTIPGADLYLLGILASSAMRFFAQSLTGTKPGGFLVLKTMYVEQFPIPACSRDQKLRIRRVVAGLVDADTGLDQRRNLEEEIDDVVYSVFDLSPSQVQLICEETANLG
jgi:hypothetical protein